MAREIWTGTEPAEYPFFQSLRASYQANLGFFTNSEIANLQILRSNVEERQAYYPETRRQIQAARRYNTRANQPEVGELSFTQPVIEMDAWDHKQYLRDRILRFFRQDLGHVKYIRGKDGSIKYENAEYRDNTDATLRLTYNPDYDLVSIHFRKPLYLSDKQLVGKFDHFFQLTQQGNFFVRHDFTDEHKKITAGKSHLMTSDRNQLLDPNTKVGLNYLHRLLDDFLPEETVALNPAYGEQPANIVKATIDKWQQDQAA